MTDRRYRYGIALWLLASALPAVGQVDEDIPSPVPVIKGGEIAQTAAGQAGQRQTRETLGQTARIEPMARISSRVQNRVQTRLRSRLDRFYDPQANAAAPFAVADERVRSPRPR